MYIRFKTQFQKQSVGNIYAHVYHVFKDRFLMRHGWKSIKDCMSTLVPL